MYPSALLLLDAAQVYPPSIGRVTMLLRMVDLRTLSVLIFDFYLKIDNFLRLKCSEQGKVKSLIWYNLILEMSLQCRNKNFPDIRNYFRT